MATRLGVDKLRQLLESFWEVLEAAYYGRFSLRTDSASPVVQLLTVGTALTIAMSLSVLTSVVALPLVFPVILSWCLVAPCRGRLARRLQGALETCAAGILIPFVCLWCSSVALVRVSRVVGHSTVKSSFHFYARVIRIVRKQFDRPRPSQAETILPLHHTDATELVESSPTKLHTEQAPQPPPNLSLTRPDQGRKTSSRAFRFLNLPPEVRNAVYREAFAPYNMLVCVPTRLLRANKEFKKAMSLLRTCRQIRQEAGTLYFSSAIFHVFTRYPFYRNIDPQILGHMREVHLMTFSNSRGFTGLERILNWDLRRMNELRRLTITMGAKDLLKSQELVGNALRDMKRDYCRLLELATLLVLTPTSSAPHVRDRLRHWLKHAEVTWGPRCWTSVSSDTSRKGPNFTTCVGELATRYRFRRASNVMAYITR